MSQRLLRLDIYKRKRAMDNIIHNSLIYALGLSHRIIYAMLAGPWLGIQAGGY
jgi:hypothetical protein